MGRPKSLNDIQIETVITSYLNGESKEQLAKFFGVSSGTILKIIRDNNIVRNGIQEKLAIQNKVGKFKTTLFEKYGVTATMNCPSILGKSKQTQLERYGETSHMKTDTTKAKIRQRIYLQRRYVA